MSLSLQVPRSRFVLCFDALLRAGLSAARSLDARSPWAARCVRRCVLILWWSATLQLHIHARYWLRARRLRRVVPACPILPAVDDVNAAELVLPCAEDPLVSVIIPTYGQVPFSLRCLASIAAHSPAAKIEVIVVDDAWAGPETALLQQVRGIRLLHNEVNLGFLHSANLAAKLAKGQFLYFLNNDTQVLDGWLDPMLALFKARPDAGAVCAKLLYPDGRLQEAGGIIWRDASGWNFGRNDDPARPAYNYVREVDYGSGAALMVERAVFSRLGGFDKRFAPAYYEDTDLCFRLRQIGLKVLYQPAAQVVHFEGVSHGRDTTVGVKSYQAVNRKTFQAVWATELANRHFTHGERVFRARDRAIHRTMVLVIDHYVPEPDRDAGSRAIMTCLDILLGAGFVVKFWPQNLAYSPGYTEALQNRGIEVFYGPHQPALDVWIKSAGCELDTVLVSRPNVAEDVIPLLRQHSNARIVYYGHDLHFRRMHMQAEVARDAGLRCAADLMRERECAIWRQADLSLYLSEEETQIALALRPEARVETVVPYCFDTFGVDRLAPANHEIIFVAGFGHPPNQDAARWFVSDVLPLICAGVPEARLSIIGSRPTAAVRMLAGPGVTVQADLTEAELGAAYARARVAVVPLRCGAGVKLKVVEALRAGLPLVTTPVGAQGLPGLRRIASVEDDATRFAAAVVRLLRDDSAWQDRSRAQATYARERFSRQAMAESLLRAMEPDCQPGVLVAG